MAPSDILYICACGRRTTLGLRCAWCSMQPDNEDPSIDWKSLEDYLDCEKYLEEEEEEE